MSRYLEVDDGRRRGRSASARYGRQSPDENYYYAAGALPAPPMLASRLHNDRSWQEETDDNALQAPTSRRRPRSVPPSAVGALIPRRRGSRASSTSSRERPRDGSPVARARHTLRDTFSPSGTGLGVGILGAIVGGLAAHEVSEAAARREDRHHDRHRDIPHRHVIASVVGAAVGGLGANALERRLEDRRHGEFAQLAWGRRRSRDRAEDGVKKNESRRRSRRGRGTAADYYDVSDGYDHVYDRKWTPRQAGNGIS